MSGPSEAAPGPGGAAGRPVSNPFDSTQAAQRYATARPYYHRTALGLAAGQLGPSHARVAVDVACGTGLSTQAVLELADHVIALDTSAAMLGAAQPHARARYIRAAAEQLPLGDACADLATVGAAFHWFDQPRAFAELARVLRGGAALIVYTDFFHGQLAGQPAFTTWLSDAYLPRYPAPPRHAYFDPAAALPAGFGDVSYTEGTLAIPLTCTELAGYLLSQSNAAAAIDSGATSACALRARILGEISPFFAGQAHAEAIFGIRVWTTVRRC
jgi:SAM-dependent methyltransferase